MEVIGMEDAYRSITSSGVLAECRRQGVRATSLWEFNNIKSDALDLVLRGRFSPAYAIEMAVRDGDTIPRD